MQKIYLILAILAGLFFAYLDSRPSWDDTGVLIFGILLTTGILSALSGEYPWLFVLAVGVWIPLHSIVIRQNYDSIIALAPAFIGAFGGWFFRKGIWNTVR